VDLALGELERGYIEVADMLAAQPWLPNGPIPVHPARDGDRMSGSGSARPRPAHDGSTGT
jgi:hypothetical protein